MSLRKIGCLLLLCYLPALGTQSGLEVQTPIMAQYDFPVVLHGLSVRLDFTGRKSVSGQQFLWNPATGCLPPGEVRIAPSTFAFPRDTVPPPGASDSLVFTCDNFSTESVEIWYRDEWGSWLSAESYVVIVGQDSCGLACESDCSIDPPTLYNGLAYGLDGTDSLVVHARELLAHPPGPGLTYAFGPNPGDTLRRFGCDDLPVQPLLVYTHGEGRRSAATSTYLALYPTVDCANATGGLPARVIQGLAVAHDGSGLVTVPARAFQPTNVPIQSLAFSPDPTDTLLTFDCDSIGSGGVPIQLYNHGNGTAGPAATSYLIGDDGRDSCGDEAATVANDSLENFFTVPADGCERFFQFDRAGRDPVDDFPQNEGGSAWYRITENGDVRVTIRALDSLVVGLISGTPRAGNTFGELRRLGPGEMTSLESCGGDIDGGSASSEAAHFTLRVHQPAVGARIRFFVGVETDECTGTLEHKVRTINAFPNPAGDRLRFSLPAKFRDKRLVYTLRDISGRPVKSGLTSPSGSAVQTIATRGLPPGLYVLSVRASEGTFVAKIAIR